MIEWLVGRLKEYRRIATRHDKLAASYLAFSPRCDPDTVSKTNPNALVALQ